MMTTLLDRVPLGWTRDNETEMRWLGAPCPHCDRFIVKTGINACQHFLHRSGSDLVFLRPGASTYVI